MKCLITIWLLLVTGILFSQDHLISFTSIDRTVQTQDANDPATLAKVLTEPWSTEKEKVRAIFRWITEHISYYKVTPRASSRKREPVMITDDDFSDTSVLKPLTERIAVKMLKDRRGYCDGYARLFKSLCDHAGIRSEIITGYARSDIMRAEEKFRSNHSWNSVYFDSAWHLLDVTWASGYLDRSSNFVKHYDDYYFLTPPEQFIRHHYPDDLRWTLLASPTPLYEFRYTPFRQRSYVKYDITDYYPSRGIIEARVGDTIHFEIRTPTAFRNLSIAPDSLWDTSALIHTPSYTYLQPESIRRDKVSYSFCVDSEAVEWLHVMYNNDAVLRYRLKILK